MKHIWFGEEALNISRQIYKRVLTKKVTIGNTKIERGKQNGRFRK